MGCINCENEIEVTFAVERFPCLHCGEKVVIEYHMCSNCGIVWRTVDGAVDSGSIVTPDMRKTFDAEGLDDILGTLQEIHSEEHSMEELLHRCLQCNAISFEVKKGEYECVECGFMWEVVGCE